MDEWKAIPGYEGLYEVSNLGEVRSARSGHGTYVGKVLKQRLNRDGYLIVNLSKQGVNKTRMVHQLVALAFLGPRPENLVVNHKDGSKSNNLVTNLEYVSVAENTHHAYTVNLRICQGANNPNAKLSWEQVLTIRVFYAIGFSQQHLASSFEISRKQVWNIIRGYQWRSLES